MVHRFTAYDLLLTTYLSNQSVKVGNFLPQPEMRKNHNKTELAGFSTNYGYAKFPVSFLFPVGNLVSLTTYDYYLRFTTYLSNQSVKVGNFSPQPEMRSNGNNTALTGLSTNHGYAKFPFPFFLSGQKFWNSSYNLLVTTYNYR